MAAHLASAGAAWTSSHLAFAQSRNGSLAWSAALRPSAAELRQSLRKIAPEDFDRALGAEIVSRADAMLRGIERYRRHPWHRPDDEKPVRWQQGATKILDYGPAEGAPLLVVPSLINKAYVLDLLPEASLMRHLAAHGIRPLLIEWGRPGDDERGFGLDDYIADRLEDAAEEAVAATGRKLAVLGYCMGGL
ncbi:MAG: alpha/beta fold hydrolase, partial [Stellaceae bacterium]